VEPVNVRCRDLHPTRINFKWWYHLFNTRNQPRRFDVLSHFGFTLGIDNLAGYQEATCRPSLLGVDVRHCALTELSDAVEKAFHPDHRSNPDHCL
jgi:hypothetical protein